MADLRAWLATDEADSVVGRAITDCQQQGLGIQAMARHVRAELLAAIDRPAPVQLPVQEGRAHAVQICDECGDVCKDPYALPQRCPARPHRHLPIERRPLMRKARVRELAAGESADEDARLRDGLAAAYTLLVDGDAAGAQRVLEVVMAGGDVPGESAEPGDDVSIALPGLRCPRCRRVRVDPGGGRACYSGLHDDTGCQGTVMESVSLVASVHPPTPSEGARS